MTILAVILASLSCLAGLVWLSRHLMISRELRTGFILTEAYGRAPAGETPLPFISVLVAAKDEQENIARCVRSILAQDYPNFEMLVINDRSTDRTAEIVSEIAKEDPRLRLLNITELPPGWCGKNNAMRVGIAAAKSQWLCMGDADCAHTSTGTLRSAVRYALDTKADLLSVLPNLEMKGFWENCIQPVCSGIMIIWFNPGKVNDPKAPQAYANGAFMLIRREAYEAVGGHEAVKDQVNEDMHMAARVKAAGLKLRVVRNHGLLLARMYTSLKAILRGWSRIFYGTFGTLPRLSASLAVMLVMGLLPYATAIFGLAAAAASGHAEPGGAVRLFLVTGLIGLAAVALQVSAIFRFYRLAGARPAYAFVYWLGCAFGLLVLLQAVGKLRKGAQVNWRNTTYTRPG